MEIHLFIIIYQRAAGVSNKTEGLPQFLILHSAFLIKKCGIHNAELRKRLRLLIHYTLYIVNCIFFSINQNEKKVNRKNKYRESAY